MPGRIPGRSTKGVFRRSGKGVLGQGVIPPQDLVDTEDGGAFIIDIVYSVYQLSSPYTLIGSRSASGITTNEGLDLIMEIMFNKEENNNEYFREVRNDWSPTKTSTYADIGLMGTINIGTNLDSQSGTNPYTRIESTPSPPPYKIGAPYYTVYGVANIQYDGSQWRLVHAFDFDSPITPPSNYRAGVEVTTVLTI